jgi:hypothetical protein
MAAVYTVLTAGKKVIPQTQYVVDTTKVKYIE